MDQHGLVRFVGTTFYSGYITSKAPGTIGSLVALGGYFLLTITGFNSLLPHCVVILSAFILSVWAGNHAECFNGQHDPKELNMDEVCGQMVAFLPLTIHHESGLGQMLIAFILFRAFDIFKPFPVSYFDRNFKNGWGVTLDDVIAGLYAVIILEGIYMFT